MLGQFLWSTFVEPAKPNIILRNASCKLNSAPKHGVLPDINRNIRTHYQYLLRFDNKLKKKAVAYALGEVCNNKPSLGLVRRIKRKYLSTLPFVDKVYTE